MGEQGHAIRFLRHTPNALTLFRLVLAAWFVVAEPWMRVWIVLAAGLTDLLDGLIARRFGLASWIGALLDAIADKAFTLTVLVSLTVWGELAPWQIVFLLSRDIVVGLIAAYGAAHQEWAVFKQVPARWPGKITTALMFALLVAATGLPEVKACVLWPTMAASVVAAVDYAGQFRRWLAARRAAHTIRTDGHTGRSDRSP